MINNLNLWKVEEKSNFLKHEEDIRKQITNKISIEDCINGLSALEPRPITIYTSGKEIEIDMIKLEKPLIYFDILRYENYQNPSSRVESIHIDLNYYDLLLIIMLKLKESKNESNIIKY